MRVPSDHDEERESQLLSTQVDPLARAVLDAVEPWDAYRMANDIPSSFLEALAWMPHGGSLYKTWAELTDLFETGKTPISEAHAALRQAATDWLARPGEPTSASIEMWLERTQTSLNELVDRDGDFWGGPKE